MLHGRPSNCDCPSRTQMGWRTWSWATAPGPSPGAGPQNGQITAAAGVTWSESGDSDVTGWADGDSDLPGSTRVDSDPACVLCMS